MEKILFTKMTGAGNDFIVIKKEDLFSELDEKLIKLLCNRNFGIGADGILLFSASNDADFRVEYYNSDGSSGTLCGNGARCAVQFAYENNYIKNSETKFTFFDDVFYAEVLKNELIRFLLPIKPLIKTNLEIYFENKKIVANYVNIGSEHAIIFYNDFCSKFYENPVDFPIFDNFDVLTIGKKIRYHKDFEPKGVNVSFVNIKSENRLQIRTYERGVENETLACGTGSTSAAMIYSLFNKIQPPIELETRSGNILTIDFLMENNLFNKISLTGPAKKTFEGKFYLNKF